MELVEVTVNPADLNPDPKEILFLLGPDGQENGLDTKELVRQCINSCRELAEPRAGYVSFPAAPAPSAGRIQTGTSIFRTGSRIARMLTNARDFHFFLATIGPAPEKLARDLMKKGDYLNGYVTDLAASALAEEVAGMVHDRIRTTAGLAGAGCSNRYSPGYCGWKVDEQQMLFRLFPEQPLGITLSPSSLMLPVKSVSGVVATGPGVTFQDYTCEICNMKNCPYRKK
jgi:hypothetical protein